MRKLLSWLCMGVLLGCAGSPPPRSSGLKVVVLAFEGVAPDLVRRWSDQFPNISRLSRDGTFADLATTNPPQAPVTWAGFATGLKPGKAGFFGSYRRDLDTYAPSADLVTWEKPEFLLNFLPIRSARAINSHRGTPYWQKLDQAGIATVNLRMPLEFPPRQVQYGRSLAGLGLPDVRSTPGTYYYLATDLSRWDLGGAAHGRQVKLELQDGRSSFELEGPPDPRQDQPIALTVPVEIELDANSTAVTVRVQGQVEKVREGQWSDWFEFDFSAGPFVSILGIGRFFVLETFPEVRLYLTPLGHHPRNPYLDISVPQDYSAQLVERYGLFQTLGCAHQTWGFNEEKIDETIFLEDLLHNMDDLERMLLGELDRGEASVYSAVFTATDSVSHLFYRCLDPDHPGYDKDLSTRWGDAILRVYQRMDSVIGGVLERLGPDDLLLVVSDHGVQTWRKEFNTNTWLLQNGFLQLMEAPADSGNVGEAFVGVDWRQTRAYALGPGQIFINLKRRERKGVVREGEEYQQTREEIRAKLAEYLDPDTGQRVVKKVYLREELFAEHESEAAPDLQVSFQPGYRTSWETLRGGVAENILVANLSRWSGDHADSDAGDVPGILLCNRRIEADKASLLDIAPTLYRLFDIEIPPEVDGKPLPLEKP